MNLNNINTLGNDYLTNSVVLNVDELNTTNVANDEFNQLKGIRIDLTIQDQIDGITSGTGIVGPAGPIGPAGPAGISFVWMGAYQNDVIYKPYDCVSYNGSSYICVYTCLNATPSTSSVVFWNLLCEKGDKGDKGVKGDTGDEGPRGPKGDDGSDGSGGGSAGGVDILAIVALVISALGDVATAAALATLQGQVSAMQLVITGIEIEQATMTTKLLYQTTLNPATDGFNATRFSSQVRVSSGFNDEIILNPYGDNYFYNKTVMNDDFKVEGHTQINTLNISHNIASGLLFGPTDTFTPNASITHSPPVIPSGGVDNQGFLNVDAGTINIGTITNLTTVNLKGASVNMTGQVNVLGSLSLNGVPIIPNGLQANGFFNQWV